MLKQFNVTLPDVEEPGQDMFPSFLQKILEVVVETPLSNATYHLLTESTRLLLVLVTSQTALKEMMTSKMAETLTSSLFLRFTAQESAPPRIQGGGLVSGLWSILTLGYGGAGPEEQEGGSPTPLADTSLQLLLLLVNHGTTSNSYSDALANFSDSSEEEHPSKLTALYTTLLSLLHTGQCLVILT